MDRIWAAFRYGGSFSRFMHVAAVGSRSEAAASSTLPAIWMQSWGSRYLNPSRGGRGHEVAKRRSAALWLSLKLSTACKMHYTGQIVNFNDAHSISFLFTAFFGSLRE